MTVWRARREPMRLASLTAPLPQSPQAGSTINPHFP